MERTDILLVEDSVELAIMARKALGTRRLADRMTWFADGEAASNYLFFGPGYGKCPELYPRLVLLDLNLPDMSGHSLLQSIKSHRMTTHIPVVMFSSSSDPRDIAKSYALGANGYLLKPTDPHEFITALAETCDYWTRHNMPVQRSALSGVPGSACRMSV